MIKSMEISEMSDKKSIRRSILEQRNALREEDKMRASLLITERLLGHQWYYQSQRILAYAAYGSELNLDMLLQEILDSGKELYLPAIVEEQMYFFRVKSLDELVTGYKGIREMANPDPYGESAYRYCEQTVGKDLLIMPGVAFDIYGNRIGYGKGFYDRFLADKGPLRLRSIAVAYEMQVLPHVPHEEQDIMPYQLIKV